MAEARAVLPCAHTLCTKCLDRLSTTGGRRSTQSIACPTCRRRYHQAEARVLHQDAAALGAATEPHAVACSDYASSRRFRSLTAGVQLLRSGFGCKLDLISRRLLALARANPTLKALVFTQWVDMMDVVTAALSQNAVTCFKYTSKRQFPRVLQTFKLCPEPSWREQAKKIKKGEDGISADDSLVVKRNEQERMTLSTLRALLNDDRTDYYGEDDEGNDEDLTSRRMHSFWRQSVVMDGRSLARKEALPAA
ncbi:hypothetical protein PINS_up020357 [Pythium insidiosum]|nr:hypothetical protein PINS_up020357 [Pythium insidiosum]